MKGLGIDDKPVPHDDSSFKFVISLFAAGKIINSKYWESQGVFSPDAKYLYFVSNRPGGYGGNDIWKSEFLYRWDYCTVPFMCYAKNGFKLNKHLSVQ